MQITTGIRKCLSIPIFYTCFQKIMGANRNWFELSNFHLRASVNESILDLGCGPAGILDYLPRVDYWGFDISEIYIDKAKNKYGDRGKFFSKILKAEDLNTMPKFDLVLACGLIHHLDDKDASAVFEIGMKALKPNGRMITFDPCYVPRQNKIARFLISKDRGQNVRNQAEYESLAVPFFSNVRSTIKHRLWIPYTHCIMECENENTL